MGRETGTGDEGGVTAKVVRSIAREEARRMRQAILDDLGVSPEEVRDLLARMRGGGERADTREPADRGRNGKRDVDLEAIIARHRVEVALARAGINDDDLDLAMTLWDKRLASMTEREAAKYTPADFVEGLKAARPYLFQTGKAPDPDADAKARAEAEAKAKAEAEAAAKAEEEAKAKAEEEAKAKAEEEARRRDTGAGTPPGARPPGGESGTRDYFKAPSREVEEAIERARRLRARLV